VANPNEQRLRDEEEYVEAVNQRRELTKNDFIDRPETH
jgi:hypothetical protein